MSAYEAIVYDLDGTLVDLDVDWDGVLADVRRVYERANVPAPSGSLWECYEHAGAVGLLADVETVISRHERAGAQTSRRLELAEEALSRSVPVGVCSLNSERACKMALATHGLDAVVDAVVGRDTLETQKPHPEPLVTVVRALAAEPARTLFVGDSPSDETTARRAGTAFAFVSERT